MSTADSNSIAMRPSCMAAASILSALRTCYGIGPEYSQTYACFALYIEQVGHTLMNAAKAANVCCDGVGLLWCLHKGFVALLH